MKPIYLHIQDFFSHKDSGINFSSFNSAMIIGKMDGNDLVSNGVGKTTIFRAIEYVLFNQMRDPVIGKDILLDKIIRDDTDKCRITLDFTIDEEIYRVVRARTRKGVSDLSLYKRSTIENGKNPHTPEVDKELWQDISSRRTQDTEADLIKQIKTNYKAFINTHYFMQFEIMSGLAAATPEKRKVILKEAFDLVVYTKLEKMVKEEASNIMKEIEKDRIIVSTIGNPTNDIIMLENNIKDINANILTQENEVATLKDELTKNNNGYNDVMSKISVLENKIADQKAQKTSLSSEIAKIEASINDTLNKKKQLISEVKTIKTSLDDIRAQIETLAILDFTSLNSYKEKIKEYQEILTSNNVRIKDISEKLIELKIPMPNAAECKHCRQILTDEHKQICKEKIDIEIVEKELLIQELQEQSKTASYNQKDTQKIVQDLEYKERLLLDLKNKESLSIKDIDNKKKIHDEYVSIFSSKSSEILDKQFQLEALIKDFDHTVEQEIGELKQLSHQLKIKVSTSSNNYDVANTELNKLNSQKAIYLHTKEEKEKSIIRKAELEKTIYEQEAQYSIYPLVVQAFSSTGIPSFIIQGVLQDLQEATNQLLTQLRPGLQIIFSTEKEKTDGTIGDTLDINYLLNNRSRDYSQLSGAQKLCITFALKLGLSFVLKQMTNTKLDFLLLDEVDQALDAASIYALSDIIKYLQQYFTILVISHNDRLKEQFSNYIVVQQDQNMVSRIL